VNEPGSVGPLLDVLGTELGSSAKAGFLAELRRHVLESELYTVRSWAICSDRPGAAARECLRAVGVAVE
jgi:hypothetical protein